MLERARKSVTKDVINVTEYYVNTTGVSPASIGLVQRLMSIAIGAAMFGGEGCDPIGSAVQVQALVLCTLVLDPGWINTPSEQCLT